MNIIGKNGKYNYKSTSLGSHVNNQAQKRKRGGKKQKTKIIIASYFSFDSSFSRLLRYRENMATRSLRRTVFRALSSLQSSSNSIEATQNLSLFSLSNYSAESSTSASYSRPNFSCNIISRRRFSSLTEEESHVPAAVNYA